MENENAIIRLTEELVSAKDDVSNLESDLSSVRADKNELYKTKKRLIELIINNTKLDYNDRDLTIDNDTAILQLIKFLEPSMYNYRLEELLRLKLEETNKKLDKEAGENGKS